MSTAGASNSGGCEPAPSIDVLFNIRTRSGRECKLRLPPGAVPVSSIVGFLDSVIAVRPKGRRHHVRRQRKGKGCVARRKVARSAILFLPGHRESQLNDDSLILFSCTSVHAASVQIQYI